MPRKKCSCENHPVFNVPGETRPICCMKCKTDEMIDVVHKKCPCGNRSSYKSQKIREKRFEEVVTIVENILKTHDTRVVYVGFD